MLAELGVVEQRYRAVLEVLDEGVSVTEVAGSAGRGQFIPALRLIHLCVVPGSS